ncbi:VIT1/CCC1 transporter family protein [Patescibacteria group bacterium]|nr:VIT1/CCC1 transporter family protein [Patescibacteria group bacterium]MBU1705496.1 VIT1/CCC1 transporter family protein [Patescibacteria group bacterium]
MFLKIRPKAIVSNIREIVFGLEDSLVSTLGAVTGIAAGAQNTYMVILAGLTLIAVEASSMAAGSYLSSKSYAAAQTSALNNKHKDCEHVLVQPIRAGLVMGVCYFAGGFVPLLPYFLLPIKDSYLPSILATVAVLYLLGVWSAKYTKRSRVKSGLEMAGISLGAAMLGYGVGRLVSYYFGVDLP